jgi:hypothetical protein
MNRQQKMITPRLVFSELPSLLSAGSRSSSFHTYLGCKLRSLIRVSLGWFDYSKIKKNVRKDNPTARRGGCHSALSKKNCDEDFSCGVVVTKLNHKEHDFVTGFQNDHAISIGERREISIRQRPGYTVNRRKKM